MNKPKCKICCNLIIKEKIKSVNSDHTRIEVRVLLEGSLNKCGGYKPWLLKVSDALCDMELQQPPHLFQCANIAHLHIDMGINCCLTSRRQKM